MRFRRPFKSSFRNSSHPNLAKAARLGFRVTSKIPTARTSVISLVDIAGVRLIIVARDATSDRNPKHH